MAARKQKPNGSGKGTGEGKASLPALPPPSDPPKDELNARERLFVTYYCGICCFNATRSVIMAGLTDNEASAAVIGHRMLRVVKVQLAVSEELARRGLEHKEIVAAIVSEYMKIGFANITNGAQFNAIMVAMRDGTELPPEVTAAIKAVTQTENGVKIEFHDKTKALDSLSRIHGMFDDRMRSPGEEHESVVERLYKERQAKKEREDATK